MTVIPGEEELGEQKRCTVCGEWWPMDAEFFYRNRHTPSGFTARCRDCYQKTYRTPHFYEVQRRRARRDYMRQQRGLVA